eukprot:6178582-Pleurochrysis_carterae.AAC.1
MAWRGELTLPKSPYLPTRKVNQLGKALGYLPPAPVKWCGNRSESFVCAHFSGRTNNLAARYARTMRSRQRIIVSRTERELRQQGARGRDRDLGANCLERRGGIQLRDRERGDRKSGRALTKRRHTLTLSNAANVLLVCRMPTDAHTSSP